MSFSTDVQTGLETRHDDSRQQAAAPSISMRRPPGPPGILGGFQMLREPFPYLLRTWAEYGDVVGYRLLTMRMYLVVHPDGVSRVLHENHRNYSKANLDYAMLKQLLGEGLLTSEGPHWLRQRRLMQPVFQRQKIAAFGPIMTAGALEMLEGWSAYAMDGRPFDVAAEMTRLTLRIVARALFSVDISATADTISTAMTVANEHFGRFSLLTAFIPFLPTPENLRFRAAVRTLDRVVRDMIGQRRREGIDKGDLLSMLLAARDEQSGEAMDDTQVRDEVMTLMLAGHETTANALAWTWYLLACNPDAEARLHTELREVLGERPPSIEDLPRLAYTRMVIEESMRLYPPAWGISRTPLEDDEIGGYLIRKGSIVMLSQYLTHRHPAMWKDPERFDPLRFSPDRTEDPPRFAYFPFGGGPRLCIGNIFALAEAQLVLAAVAQRYRLRLVPGHPVELQPLVTLRPRYGIRVTLEPLKG
jgi:cytochrome P450